MNTIRQRIERIENECRGCWGESGVSSWERDRLEEWKDRESLSPKQLAILQRIERKVFGGEEEGEAV